MMARVAAKKDSSGSHTAVSQKKRRRVLLEYFDPTKPSPQHFLPFCCRLTMRVCLCNCALSFLPSFLPSFPFQQQGLNQSIFSSFNYSLRHAGVKKPVLNEIVNRVS